MGRKRPEREMVKQLIQEHKYKANEIAEKAGIIETMGYEKAVEYVRQVRKSLRKREAIKLPDLHALDAERMEDISTLFDIRAGKMAKSDARNMLLLNCYYRLRSRDDSIHLQAIDDTYEKNAELKKPIPMQEAIRICENALENYMNSIDAKKIAAAIKKGYPGAGLNYSNDRLIDILGITPEEQTQLRTF